MKKLMKLSGEMMTTSTILLKTTTSTIQGQKYLTLLVTGDGTLKFSSGSQPALQPDAVLNEQDQGVDEGVDDDGDNPFLATVRTFTM